MGWASLIEDVIERFDADATDSPFVPSPSVGPTPRTAAERARLDREQLANEIAVREYWKNGRKSEQQQALIARLQQQLEKSNQELRGLKSKLSDTAKANEQIEKGLAKYRVKFAQRVARSAVITQNRPQTPNSTLATKIENFKEKDWGVLTQESRERFLAFKAYASSERKVEAQEIEIATLNQSLAEVDQELTSLRSFCEEIVRENRALGAEAKTFEGWETMNEWLKENPTISPKELDSNQITSKGKKPEKPTFNPVFKEGF